MRLLWSQLRAAPGRALALLLGIAVATAAFTVLTGSSSTARLQVQGTVTANSRAAYDVLVRPHGSVTGIEASRGLVRANYLSGLYGGITMADYRTVGSLPGVEVAAPVAMIGYVLPYVAVPIDLTRFSEKGRQAFRVSVHWSTDRGLTTLSDVNSYVYVTDAPLKADQSPPFALRENAAATSGPVCPTADTKAQGPFDLSSRAELFCWSRSNGLGGNGAFPGFAPGHVGFALYWPFPLLVAAVDPAAEARLAGVDRAVTAGRYLHAGERAVRNSSADGTVTTVPVIAANRTYSDDTAQVRVERLDGAALPAFAGSDPARLQRLAGKAPGTAVLNTRIGATAAYQQLLGQLSGDSGGFFAGLEAYWTPGPTVYQPQPNGALSPVAVRNKPTVWSSQLQSTGFVHVPLTADDTAFRGLREHVASNQAAGGAEPFPVPRAVGRFDPTRLAGFSPLSAVPLETYNPPVAVGADAATRRLLGGQPLLPNGNIAGYLEQPPLLLTTLEALPAFTDPAVFSDTSGAAPISVIRVRVASVHGVDSVSRERVRAVAEEIHRRTGLDVDVTLGSSPTPVRVDLPAGEHGRPSLALREGWVRKGVSVAILKAVDRKSLLLFGLILIVCGLFVANAAIAAVRARRTELGVLACLGWPRHRLFAMVLTELVAIGTAAGVLGCAAALLAGPALGVPVSAGRALLAVPVALLLTILAGLTPAVLAAQAVPAAAVRPAVQTGRRPGRPGTVAALALINVRRVPGRTLAAAVSLAVGVAALVLLLATAFAFRGVLVGSLLGDALTVQVRGVDVLAVIVTVVLGSLAVADVQYLNLQERAVELAAMRAMGWTERELVRLIALEGLAVGALGSLVGAAVGLAGAAAFAGEVPTRLIGIAAGAALAGALLAGLTATLPAAALRWMPTAELLAQE